MTTQVDSGEAPESSGALHLPEQPPTTGELPASAPPSLNGTPQPLEDGKGGQVADPIPDPQLVSSSGSPATAPTEAETVKGEAGAAKPSRRKKTKNAASAEIFSARDQDQATKGDGAAQQISAFDSHVNASGDVQPSSSGKASKKRARRPESDDKACSPQSENGAPALTEEAKHGLLPEQELLKCDITAIIPSATRAQGDIAEMAESLEEVGQLEPLVCCRQADNTDNVELLAGHRRFLAAKFLGWTWLWVSVYPPLSDQQKVAVKADSDLVTKPLTLFERAVRMAERKPIPGAKRQTAALDESRERHRRNFTRLVKDIPEPLRQRLNDTEVGDVLFHMLELAKIKSPELQADVVEYLFKAQLVDTRRDLGIDSIAQALGEGGEKVRKVLLQAPTLKPDVIYGLKSLPAAEQLDLAKKLAAGEAVDSPSGERPKAGSADSPSDNKKAATHRSSKPRSHTIPETTFDEPRSDTGLCDEPPGFSALGDEGASLIGVDDWLQAIEEVKTQTYFVRQAIAGAGCPNPKVTTAIYHAMSRLDGYLDDLRECLRRCGCNPASTLPPQRSNWHASVGGL